jgi:hypothetical protein
LHSGSFELTNAAPGLRATIRLPHAPPPAMELPSAGR